MAQNTALGVLTSGQYMLYEDGQFYDDAPVVRIDLSNVDLSIFDHVPILYGHKDTFTEQDILGFTKDPFIDDAGDVHATLVFKQIGDPELYNGRDLSISYRFKNYDSGEKTHEIESVDHVAIVENGRCYGCKIYQVYTKENDNMSDRENIEISVTSENGDEGPQGAIVSEGDGGGDGAQQQVKSDADGDGASLEDRVTALESGISKILETLSTLQKGENIQSGSDDPKEEGGAVQSSFDPISWCAMTDKIARMTGVHLDLDDFDGDPRRALKSVIPKIQKTMALKDGFVKRSIQSSAPSVLDYQRFVSNAYDVFTATVEARKQENDRLIQSSASAFSPYKDYAKIAQERYEKTQAFYKKNG